MRILQIFTGQRIDFDRVGDCCGAEARFDEVRGQAEAISVLATGSRAVDYLMPSGEA